MTEHGRIVAVLDQVGDDGLLDAGGVPHLNHTGGPVHVRHIQVAGDGATSARVAQIRALLTDASVPLVVVSGDLVEPVREEILRLRNAGKHHPQVVWDATTGVDALLDWGPDPLAWSWLLSVLVYSPGDYTAAARAGIGVPVHLVPRLLDAHATPSGDCVAIYPGILGKDAAWRVPEICSFLEGRSVTPRLCVPAGMHRHACSDATILRGCLGAVVLPGARNRYRLVATHLALGSPVLADFDVSLPQESAAGVDLRKRLLRPRMSGDLAFDAASFHHFCAFIRETPRTSDVRVSVLRTNADAAWAGAIKTFFDMSFRMPRKVQT